MHFKYKNTCKLKINARGKTHHKDNTMRRLEWLASGSAPLFQLPCWRCFPSLVVSVWGQLLHTVCPEPPVSNTSCNLSTPHLLIYTWIHTSHTFKIQKIFLYSGKLLTNLYISSIVFKIFYQVSVVCKVRK